MTFWIWFSLAVNIAFACVHAWQAYRYFQHRKAIEAENECVRAVNDLLVHRVRFGLSPSGSWLDPHTGEKRH